MKIAFFTPLNPLKSGISDFCEELLMELKEHMEIDLFIGDYKPSNPDMIKYFRIRKIKEFENEEVRKEYDEVIYQIGNNEICHEEIYQMALKYPGIVELHDISLHHMIAATTIARGNVEGYKRIMRYCHGDNAVKVVDQFLNSEIVPPWENNSLIFTVNKEIIDSATGVIVHSDYAKQMVKGVRPDVKVTTIYLHADEICMDYEKEKVEARKRQNIDLKETIFATFGFITKPKRILEILEALDEIKKRGYAFKFYIVGRVDDNLNITEVIKQYNLEREVVVTGFVDMNVMKDLMKSADICFCLRYPTQGESSAIVHRLLGMGKVILVTDIGTFTEYPDNVVVKICIDNEKTEIIKKSIEIKKDIKKLSNYEKNAIDFASRDCSLKDNVIRYRDFVKGIDEYQELSINDIITDSLYRLGIIDEEIISKLCEIKHRRVKNV